jgi:DNA repair protein RadC
MKKAKKIYKREKIVKITNPYKALQIIIDKFENKVDIERENVFLIFLNLKSELIDVIHYAVGTKDSVNISACEIFSKMIEKKIDRFIILHNHPSGVLAPSLYDLEFYKKLVACQFFTNIKLDDFIIFDFKYKDFLSIFDDELNNKIFDSLIKYIFDKDIINKILNRFYNFVKYNNEEGGAL